MMDMFIRLFNYPLEDEGRVIVHMYAFPQQDLTAVIPSKTKLLLLDADYRNVAIDYPVLVERNGPSPICASKPTYPPASTHSLCSAIVIQELDQANRHQLS